MVSNYSAEELLSESQVRTLKCLKFISKFPQSLTPEEMIVELLKIYSTTLPENACLKNRIVVLQNLTEDLTFISEVLALSEKQLESAKLDKIKSREACDNISKMIGDSIDSLIKIVIDEKSNSTTNEKLNPTHITQKDLYNRIDEYMDQKFREQMAEFRELAIQIQHDHQPTTEDAALTVIKAEFNGIEKTNPSLWQVIKKQLKLLKRQALNPERHLNATKEALFEVAKHYFEESVFAKALITYLNTMSDDPAEGE